jgi:hypothetical protein
MPALKKGRAMSSKSGGGVSYGVLGLVATVVLVLLLYRAEYPHQRFQGALFGSVAPEATATSGAIGELPMFAVPP